MAEATLTGLQPTVTITMKKNKKRPPPKLDFQSCVRPVVLEVKPFGTYFNPFGAGCSVLCNHPVDTDFRPYLSPGRQTRKAIKRRDERKTANRRSDKLVEKMGRQVGGMLERMGATHEQSRKCLTPSAGHRPTLVLDLRRSQSSDNLTSVAHGNEGGKQSAASLSAVTVSSVQTIARTPLPATKEEIDAGDNTKDDDVTRRRGRKVNKKKKKSQQERPPRQPSVGMLEPNETQISTFTEGLNRAEENVGEKEADKSNQSQHLVYKPPQCSIFDLATLRHLRRNMAKIDAQAEYSKVWRRVLNEAMNETVLTRDNKMEVVNGLELPATDPDRWITLPRLFSLSAARFELPLDRNTLNFMEPLEYLREHVVVAKGKKMLYNHVFLKYSQESDRVLPSLIRTEKLWDALGEVVGGSLKKSKRDQLRLYVDWDEEDSIDLLTWYGLCAFTERIVGKETEGRSHVEEADFELLPRILTTVRPSDKLTALLKAIHAIGEPASVTASPDLWKSLFQLQKSHVTSISLEES